MADDPKQRSARRKSGEDDGRSPPRARRRGEESSDGDRPTRPRRSADERSDAERPKSRSADTGRSRDGRADEEAPEERVEQEPEDEEVEAAEDEEPQAEADEEPEAEADEEPEAEADEEPEAEAEEEPEAEADEEPEPVEDEKPRRRRRRVSPARLIRAAKEEVEALTGRPVTGVTAFDRTDNGWEVLVEVLELRRVPETMSILGLIVVTLDENGDLVGYRRLRRYSVSQVDEG